MDEAPSQLFSFIYIWRRGYVLERIRSEDHPYTLTTKEYPLPGSNLKYEHATLTFEHRPVASGIFRWFRSAISHCNSQNGRELISEMVEVFRRHKDELPETLRRFVLAQGIMEVCYRVQIDDSQLVNQVFDLLYENDHSSSATEFHDLSMFKLSYNAASAIRRKANSNQPDFLTFYFEHARRLKLEYDGTRFIDINIEGDGFLEPSADANTWIWKPLLRYLQFGVKFENVIIHELPPFQGVMSPLKETLYNLITDLWYEMVEPATSLSLTDPKAIQDYCDNLNLEVRDLCHTLRIILRTVNQLRQDVLDFFFPEKSDEGFVEVASYRVIHHPTVQLMVPRLSQRFRCPMQLQHACKWVIRERLNENWQLPAGINHLPLPDRMKKYLNLLSDEI